YYEKYEEQIMGLTYIKNLYGPTPIEFMKVIEQMENDDEIFIVENKHFFYDQKKYLPTKEPNLSIINARELEHINEILNRLSDKNADELSAYSHRDVPWITADEGKRIEYESVFYRTNETSVREYGD
ncbi:SocA family protein, partial [candidate division WOR-3 bacterium]|nr:SocA family protein [candidate division WOR-3 bacterium]